MNPLTKTIKIIKDILTGEDKTFIVTQELTDCITVIENTTDNISITGKAGTGKSTFIEYFRNTTKKKVVVLAPTGLSAINIKGQTIHSFFHLPPRFITKNAISTRINSRMYKDVDCIVIDEISMVRADVLDGIDYFLRLHGKNKNLPFGGIQMILVGDLYQLPPVVTYQDAALFEELYESPYFFSSHAFSSSTFVNIELTSIFRQKDPTFIALLNKIRNGNVSAEDLEPINERVVVKDFEKIRKTYVTLATTNNVANGINDSELAKINSPLFIYTAVIENNFPTEDRLLPADMELKLKKGARVIFVKNDKARRWVNGTSGIIETLEKDSIIVKLDEDGFHKLVTVEKGEWENVKYEYEKAEVTPVILGKFIQYPLKLAWAITIHKSQGMTFDKVNIDFSSSPFTHGQTYVALSRCRTLNGIVVTKKIWPNDIILDERVVQFSKKVARM